MAENIKLIFCKQIEGKGYLTEKWQFGQKGAWLRSRDILLLPCEYLWNGWGYKPEIFTCHL